MPRPESDVEFDEAGYLAANPDVAAAVAAGKFESGREHYGRFGRAENRLLDPEAGWSRIDKLCAGLDLDRMTGVEIGPLTDPVVTKDRGHVLYVDHADTETLRRKYGNDGKIDPDRIVPVDYVWGAQTLPECVGDGVRVDYVIASHVAEHVPDLVGWLDEVRGILRPGGTVRLALPDRRFTFDILRAESTLADVLDASLRRPRVPPPRAILDHFLNHAEIDAADAWAGRTEGLQRTHTPAFALAAAERSLREGHYQDTHCWVFTPLSFARLGAALAGLNLLGFDCERIFPTIVGGIEFIAILRAAEPALAAASWERVAAELARSTDRA